MAEENQEKSKKKKKIAKMSIQEIEVAIKNVSERMGGADSRYAKQLLKRKIALQTK